MYKLEELQPPRIFEVTKEIDGKFVPCRPEPWWGYYGFKLRVKDAWAVLTGKADAFVWPGEQ